MFLMALLAAGFGFSGMLFETAGFAQLLTYVLLGLALVSLLFSLFEEPAQETLKS